MFIRSTTLYAFQISVPFVTTKIKCLLFLFSSNPLQLSVQVSFTYNGSNSSTVESLQYEFNTKVMSVRQTGQPKAKFPFPHFHVSRFQCPRILHQKKFCSRIIKSVWFKCRFFRYRKHDFQSKCFENSSDMPRRERRPNCTHFTHSVSFLLILSNSVYRDERTNERTDKERRLFVCCVCQGRPSHTVNEPQCFIEI